MPKYNLEVYTQTGLSEHSGVGYSFTWKGEAAAILIQDDDEIIGNWRKASRNLSRFDDLCLQDATATVICSEINWLRTGDAVYTNCCFGLERSSVCAGAGDGPSAVDAFLICSHSALRSGFGAAGYILPTSKLVKGATYKVRTKWKNLGLPWHIVLNLTSEGSSCCGANGVPKIGPGASTPAYKLLDYERSDSVNPKVNTY